MTCIKVIIKTKRNKKKTHIVLCSFNDVYLSIQCHICQPPPIKIKNQTFVEMPKMQKKIAESIKNRKVENKER